MHARWRPKWQHSKSHTWKDWTGAQELSSLIRTPSYIYFLLFKPMHLASRHGYITYMWLAHVVTRKWWRSNFYVWICHKISYYLGIPFVLILHSICHTKLYRVWITPEWFLFALLVLDFRTGDIAKIVARSLSGLGFKNTWVITDGYDGGRGWVQSKLGSDSYNSSFAEILSPSRVIPAGTYYSIANSYTDYGN